MNQDRDPDFQETHRVTRDYRTWRLANGKVLWGIPDIEGARHYYSLTELAKALDRKRHEIEALFDLGAIPAQCYRIGPCARSGKPKRMRAVRAYQYVQAVYRGDFAWLDADSELDLGDNL
jgi:hypothetical protein